MVYVCICIHKAQVEHQQLSDAVSVTVRKLEPYNRVGLNPANVCIVSSICIHIYMNIASYPSDLYPTLASFAWFATWFNSPRVQGNQWIYPHGRVPVAKFSLAHSFARPSIPNHVNSWNVAAAATAAAVHFDIGCR